MKVVIYSQKGEAGNRSQSQGFISKGKAILSEDMGAVDNWPWEQVYLEVQSVNLILSFSVDFSTEAHFLTHIQISIFYSNVSLKYAVRMFSH